MKGKKILLAIMTAIIALGMLVGCTVLNINSADGHWIIKEKQWGDGYYATREYLESEGIFEEFYIGEGGGTYCWTNGDGEEYSADFNIIFNNKTGLFKFVFSDDTVYDVELETREKFFFEVIENDVPTTYIFEKVEE